MRLIFGPYEPDKPPHLQEGLSDVSNVYAGAKGYRPVGAFEPLTPALPATYSGGAAFVASDSSAMLIAGTATTLYRYVAGAWLTLATGLVAPGRWQFTQFGDLVIAVSGAATKKVDLLSASVADVPNAPTALSVATVRDFVVYGQAGGNALMVQWSGFGDQDDNTPGVNQAGFQPMLTGGAVMGIVGGEYGVIVQRSRIVRMSYTGDPDVPWQFDEISANIGAISSGSIAQSGRTIFFLSDRGFMMCDGNDVKPIGVERVDRTFFDTYARSELGKLYVTIDPRRNIVAWTMPGTPGMTLLYDWVLDRWSVIRAFVTASLPGFTANVTLEALDTLFPDGLDSVPYSLDDQRFTGGDPLMLLVDGDNAIGTFSGANMPARFRTPFIEPIPGRLARIRFARVLTDAVGGLRFTLNAKMRLGDESAAETRTDVRDSGRIPVRATGRYVRQRLDILAGTPWAYVQGTELEMAAGGAR